MARRSRDCVGINPVAADQLHEQRAIKTAFAAVIDILWHSVMTKLGKPQTGGKLAIVTRTPFSLQQKSEPFGMRKLLALAVREQRVEELWPCRSGPWHSVYQG